MANQATEPRITFVIGGVQKGGTTALAQYLAAHPGIRLPTGKEAHVFDAPGFDDAWDAATVDAQYAAHFPQHAADVLLGDATPFYLFHPDVVARIARYNPGMRWIILLRDPATRALSQFNMERERGREHMPLWFAVLMERWRIRGDAEPFARGSRLRRHSYRARGDYARQLDHLLTLFPREQVLLIRSEDLLRDPHAHVSEACAFLGLPPPPDGIDYAPVFVSATPPSSANSLTTRWLRWLLRKERADLSERYGIDFDT